MRLSPSEQFIILLQTLLELKHIIFLIDCKQPPEFSQADYLKRHIDTVHEGRKDHKCKSSGKLFSLADYLKYKRITNVPLFLE